MDSNNTFTHPHHGNDFWSFVDNMNRQSTDSNHVRGGGFGRHGGRGGRGGRSNFHDFPWHDYAAWYGGDDMPFRGGPPPFGPPPPFSGEDTNTANADKSAPPTGNPERPGSPESALSASTVDEKTPEEDNNEEPFHSARGGRHGPRGGHHARGGRGGLGGGRGGRGGMGAVRGGRGGHHAHDHHHSRGFAARGGPGPERSHDPIPDFGATPFGGRGMGMFGQFPAMLARGLGRGFTPGLAGGRGPTGDILPPYELYDAPELYIVHVVVPGAKKGDIDVSFETATNNVKVSGLIKRPEEIDTAMMDHLITCSREVGYFEVAIALDGNDKVDADGLTAKLEDGILKIELPKISGEDWTEIKKVQIE